MYQLLATFQALKEHEHAHEQTWKQVATRVSERAREQARTQAGQHAMKRTRAFRSRAAQV